MLYNISVEHKYHKQRLITRILRKANGEQRIVNAALVSLNAFGWSNYQKIMEDVQELLENHPDASDRIMDAIESNAGLA